jgi:hypothetical protein
VCRFLAEFYAAPGFYSAILLKINKINKKKNIYYSVAWVLLLRFSGSSLSDIRMTEAGLSAARFQRIINGVRIGEFKL